jgi:hypothetical protein
VRRIAWGSTGRAARSRWAREPRDEREHRLERLSLGGQRARGEGEALGVGGAAARGDGWLERGPGAGPSPRAKPGSWAARGARARTRLSRSR